MRRSTLLAVAVTLVLGVGGCRKPAEPANPAEMKENLAEKVGWILSQVEPTGEQRKQVDGVLDRLAPDLFALQEQNNTLKRQFIAVLSADAVDPKALEAARQESLALFDRYTRRMLQAGEEAIGILTPEQRKRLVGMWKRYEFGRD